MLCIPTGFRIGIRYSSLGIPGNFGLHSCLSQGGRCPAVGPYQRGSFFVGLVTRSVHNSDSQLPRISQGSIGPNKNIFLVGAPADSSDVRNRRGTPTRTRHVLRKHAFSNATMARSLIMFLLLLINLTNILLFILYSSDSPKQFHKKVWNFFSM